jgi:hypothetical protein
MRAVPETEPKAGTFPCRLPLGQPEGTSNMIQIVATPPSVVKTSAVVQRLMDETGISAAQAIELIAFLGLNWSSLVRETRLLNPNH